MLRAGIKITGFGAVLLLLSSFVACTTGEPTTEDKGFGIADITSNPEEYEGKTVTVSGEYRGWEVGYGSAPVTRSDWVLKDETVGIYVTGKAPSGLDPVKDRGRKITVTGIVKVKDSQAYIEAKIIKVEGG